MSGSIDLAVVLAIVAVAGVYLVRRNIRNAKSDNVGCGCGCGSSCGGCDTSSTCNDPHKDSKLS